MSGGTAADRAVDGAVTVAEQRVLDLISLDDVTELTRQLVRAPGTNPPGGEAATVAALTRACANRGLTCRHTEVLPDRENVEVVLPGGSGPGLLLLGHTDVVPVGDGWSADPFSGRLHEGRVYGRGATDMKGGLAACVVAMAALQEAQVPLSGPVELAALVDEEETGHGIRHYIAAEDRGGYAGCIVAEPTDLQTIIAARGDAYFEFTVHGRPAHAGNPDDGVNAIYGAATLVADLRTWHTELTAHPHPLAGPPSWSVGQISGGTGTSIVPAECRVVADRRLVPGEDAQDVLGRVRDRVAGLRLGPPGSAPTVEVELQMSMPGFETAAEHVLVRTVDAALAAAGGPGLPLGGWTAACDGGFVARDAGVPVVVLGPGSVSGQAHRADESVSVEELLVAARAYALTAMRLLGPG